MQNGEDTSCPGFPLGEVEAAPVFLMLSLLVLSVRVEVAEDSSLKDSVGISKDVREGRKESPGGARMRQKEKAPFSQCRLCTRPCAGGPFYLDMGF